MWTDTKDFSAVDLLKKIMEKKKLNHCYQITISIFIKSLKVIIKNLFFGMFIIF